MRRDLRLFGQPIEGDSVAPAATPTPPVLTEKEYRVVPASDDGTIISLDRETGIFLSDDNFRFLEIWRRHAYKSGQHQPLTLQMIKAIRDDMYYDSDLWDDDIYNSDDIFLPTDYNNGTLDEKRTNRQRLNDRVQDYIDRMDTNRTLRGQPIAECRKYIRTRITLFKLYIYLRRCAILYRDPQIKQPFLDLITFLKEDPNFQKFSPLLMVNSVQFVGENWSAGLHEWLTRSHTLEALNRTAGLQPDVASCLPAVTAIEIQADGREEKYLCTEVNWLDIQMLMRTPTKYVQLVSHAQTIVVGHTRSVNLYLSPQHAPDGKTGFKTGFYKGEARPSFSASEMDLTLNKLLMASTNIRDYVIALHLGYNIDIFNDTTPIRPVPTDEARYLVDGTKTDDLAGLQTFQHMHLTRAHGLFRWTERDFSIQAMLAERGKTVAPTTSPTAT